MAENRNVVYVAIAAGAAISVVKFVAAGMSGSASLLAEGLHSVADTGNDCMVLLGQKRSEAPPDERHPFGHGKELYFWTMVVAVTLLAVGGLTSIIEGVRHILRPAPLEDPTWNYIALGLGVVFEGYSWTVAWRQFLREKNRDETVLEGVKHAKDPTAFLVVFEDSAALIGVAIAFLGVFLAHRLHEPWIDGAGAVGVGLVLAAVAFFLVNKIRKLLVGERADSGLLESVCELVERDDAVVRTKSPRSMHFGPEAVLLAIKAEFQPTLSAESVASAVDGLHRTIEAKHPEVKYIYIEPQVTTTHRGTEASPAGCKTGGEGVHGKRELDL